MKMSFFFRGLCALIVFFYLPLNAQDVSKKSAVLLSIGAESRGFTLSYERRIYNSSDTKRLSLRGFIGYGFNASNWSDRGEITNPGALPGRSWRMSTYFPFEDREKSKRFVYYLGDLTQYTIGIEINGKLGRKNHFLEVAYGTALDYFSRNVNFYSSRKELGDQPTYEELKKAKGSKFANHHHVRAGYRFVANNGLTLSAGLSLHQLEGFFTHFYADDRSLMPYLSAGYSF